MALERYWCSAELQKAINPQHQVWIVKQSLRECCACFFLPPHARIKTHAGGGAGGE